MYIYDGWIAVLVLLLVSAVIAIVLMKHRKRVDKSVARHIANIAQPDLKKMTADEIYDSFVDVSIRSAVKRHAHLTDEELRDRLQKKAHVLHQLRKLINDIDNGDVYIRGLWCTDYDNSDLCRWQLLVDSGDYGKAGENKS